MLKAYKYRLYPDAAQMRKINASIGTSRTCGHRVDQLDLSIREWTCSHCSTTHDRDINAAKNIAMIGLQSAVGSRKDPVETATIVASEKQESILG